MPVPIHCALIKEEEVMQPSNKHGPFSAYLKFIAGIKFKRSL